MPRPEILECQYSSSGSIVSSLKKPSTSPPPVDESADTTSSMEIRSTPRAYLNLKMTPSAVRARKRRQIERESYKGKIPRNGMGLVMTKGAIRARERRKREKEVKLKERREREKMKISDGEAFGKRIEISNIQEQKQKEEEMFKLVVANAKADEKRMKNNVDLNMNPSVGLASAAAASLVSPRAGNNDFSLVRYQYVPPQRTTGAASLVHHGLQIYPNNYCVGGTTSSATNPLNSRLGAISAIDGNHRKLLINRQHSQQQHSEDVQEDELVKSREKICFLENELAKYQRINANFKNENALLRAQHIQLLQIAPNRDI